MYWLRLESLLITVTKFEILEPVIEIELLPTCEKLLSYIANLKSKSESLLLSSKWRNSPLIVKILK